MFKLKNLFLLLVISNLFLSCSLAQDKLQETSLPKSSKVNEETKRFESKEGNFSINISQEPFKILNMGSEIADKKGIDVGKQFAWNVDRKLYTLMYMGPFDKDGNDLPQDWRDIENGTRKGILREGAKIISEKSIAYGKYSGIEFRYVSKEGIKFIGRIYLINTMGYQIVGAYGEEKNEKEVLEVLDSFKLLTEKN